MSQATFLKEKINTAMSRILKENSRAEKAIHGVTKKIRFWTNN